MSHTPIGKLEMSDTADTGVARAWWLLPLLLVIVLAGVVATGGLKNSHPQNDIQANENPVERTPGEAFDGPSVALEIDYGNGTSRRFDRLAWHTGMTVQDVLDAASQFKPGIEYVHVGDGQLGFLTEIDGLASGTSSRSYWQYWINDERADRSFAVYELSPGDEVLWKFAPEE